MDEGADSNAVGSGGLRVFLGGGKGDELGNGGNGGLVLFHEGSAVIVI